MITASVIFSKVRARLDDDGSGRYDIPNDLVPALNAAVSFWVRVLNAGFEAKRIFHESVSDLVKVKVYTATKASGSDTAYVDVTADRANIWTIFGVDPNPSVDGSSNMVETKHRWAKRVTLAEWGDKAHNTFSPGTVRTIPAAFVRPSFIGIGSYQGTGATAQIAIRPESALGAGMKVAIWFLNNPSTVVDGATNIEFPANMTELLVTKTVAYIAHQHGGQSPYFQMSEHDIMQAAQILNS